jgi:hypothetical protein
VTSAAPLSHPATTAPTLIPPSPSTITTPSPKTDYPTLSHIPSYLLALPPATTAPTGLHTHRQLLHQLLHHLLHQATTGVVVSSTHTPTAVPTGPPTDALYERMPAGVAAMDQTRLFNAVERVEQNAVQKNDAHVVFNLLALRSALEMLKITRKEVSATISKYPIGALATAVHIVQAATAGGGFRRVHPATKEILAEVRAVLPNLVPTPSPTPDPTSHAPTTAPSVSPTKHPTSHAPTTAPSVFPTKYTEASAMMAKYMQSIDGNSMDDDYSRLSIDGQTMELPTPCPIGGWCWAQHHPPPPTPHHTVPSPSPKQRTGSGAKRLAWA